MTHFERADHVKAPPAEGCYVHGLFLEGAAWSREAQTLVESEPKVLFVPLPVLWVSASKKEDELKLRREAFGPQGPYECPCYKYRSRYVSLADNHRGLTCVHRTDRYFIFMVTLKVTAEKNPAFWTMRAVGLLCNTD